MQRSIRTACLALTLGMVGLLARGQDLAPRSTALSVEQPAEQQSSLPELTLGQAVEKAVANKRSLKPPSPETVQAADDLAASRTKRFAKTQVTALGAQLLTKASLTFPEGSLGTYSATGPIPATNQKTEIPRKP